MKRTKRRLFHFTKTALLSLILFLFVAGNAAPLFAQAGPALSFTAGAGGVAGETVSIQLGASATLSWNATGLSSCNATGDWAGTKNTSGSETVSPTFTSTYTLSCTGTAGASIVKTATVVIGDSSYKNFKYLFNTAGQGQLKIGPNKSTFSFKSPIVNEDKKTVPGLWFKFYFEFNPDSPSKGAEYSWDHIAAPVGTSSFTQFMVRVCDTGTNENCVYSGVQYAEGIESIAGTNSLSNIFRSMSGNINAIFEAIRTTRVIYRKSSDGARILNPFAGSGDYLKGGSFDLFLAGGPLGDFITEAGWFTIDNPDSSNSDTDSITVDWVKKTTEKPQTASLWYCASLPNGNGNGNPAGPAPLPPHGAADNTNDPDIQKFGGLCRDTYPAMVGNLILDITGPSSYFKIGEVPISPIPSYEAAATQQATQQFEDPRDRTFESSILPACGVQIAGIGKGTVLGCVARVIYHLIYRPIAWFAGIMGNLFDFFIGYSLSDEAYRQEFLVNGWKIVRDISNIFFIIILVWTGLAAVFDIGGVSMKKVVPHLIINALIINFSLFVTRTAIDLSNVFARVFYNNINVHTVDQNTGTEITEGTRSVGGYKAISEKIVSSFNPQQLFQAKFLRPSGGILPATNLATPTNVAGGAQLSGEEQGETAVMSANEYAGYFIVITIIAAAIMFGVAMMFWKTAFLFLGRVIGLYIAVIFSPFAFLTRKNMPIVGAIPQVSWTSWLKDLTNYCLMAPIFAFFLYVIWAFIRVLPSFMKTNNIVTDGTFFQTVIAISIPLLIVYFLIKQGVEIAKKYSGMVANMVSDNSIKAVGLAGGAAMGGVGVLGSRVIGGAAAAIDKSKAGIWLRDKAATSSMARWAQGRLNRAQTGSFDARQTQLGKDLFKQMQVTTDNKYLDALKMAGVGPGLSVDQRKGGLEAAKERQQKEREDQEKLLKEKFTGADIDRINARLEEEMQEAYIKKQMLDKYGGRNGLKKIRSTRAGKDEVNAEIAALRKEIQTKNHEDESDLKLREQKNKASEELRKKIREEGKYEEKETKSVKNLENARKKQFAESLKTPDVLSVAGLVDTTITAIGKIPVVGSAVRRTVGAAVGTDIRMEGDLRASDKLGENFKDTKKDEEAKAARDKAQKARDKANAELERINKLLTDLMERDTAFAGKTLDDLTPEERDMLRENAKGKMKEKKAEYQDQFDIIQENINDMNRKRANMEARMDAMRDKTFTDKEADLKAKRDADLAEMKREYDSLRAERDAETIKRNAKRREMEEETDTDHLWDKKEKAEEKAQNAQDQYEKREKHVNDLNEAKGNKKKEEKEEKK